MTRKTWPKGVKNIYIFTSTIILVFILFGVRQALAISTSSVNLQGKIVRNDTGHEGLNVTPGNPPCVIAGAGNDTCDFRVRYYNAPSGGTLLLTEEFSNKEIGQYNGAFNLSLGTDSSPTAGTYSSLSALINGEDAVYIEIGFAPGGNNSYTEVFTRMPLQASPYAIRSKYASEASNVSWSGITNPEDNQSLTMGTHNTAWNWSTGLFSSNWDSNAGANNLFSLNTGNITGTGSLLNVQTGSSATISPLRVRAGSSEAIFVDNQGRVGLGTTSPLAKLHVLGGGIFEDLLATSPEGGLVEVGGVRYAGAVSIPAVSTTSMGAIESPWIRTGYYQNFLRYTEEFQRSTANDWVQTNIASVTANSHVAPLETATTADTIVGNSANGALTQTVAASAAGIADTGPWTFSIYLKTNSGTADVDLQINSTNASGVVVEAGTAKTVTINETWQRYSVVQDFTNASHTRKNVVLKVGTNTVIAWGAQLEPSSYARRYSAARTTSLVTTNTSTALISTALGVSGSISGTSIAASSSITSTRSGTPAAPVEGLIATAGAATAAIPVRPSPRLRLRGTAWNTTPTAATNNIDFSLETMPISGPTTSGYLRFLYGGHGAALVGHTEVARLTNTGDFTVIGNIGIGTLSPTEKLDVDGAARIRTISNASGNILTVSSTGVVQQRTPAELLGDIGAGSGDGTVTSVDVSGGTTGLTTSGGPITSSGTITLSGTLNVASGGTGNTSFTSGKILFGNGTNAIATDTDLHWDNTNKRLGVGTATPVAKLDVAGDINVSSGQGFRINNTATSGQYLRGDGTRFVSSTIQSTDLPGSFSGFASPTATVGLTATNGSATTAMRSDAAPALSQAIVPTWTGLHTFTSGATIRGLTVDHATATRDKIAISVANLGSNSYIGTITNADLTAARTWTLPDATGTLALTSSLYGSWTIKDSSSDTGESVGSGQDVQILGGTNVTTSRSGRNITISATDTNTATAADDILKGSNIGTEIKYSPYTTNEAANVRFYTSSNNPTGTSRLNIGAHFHSTRLYAGNGTSALPSLSFSADTNTGIFGTGSDVLGFSTAGSERMRIAANGNVGIGTTAPNDILTVIKNIEASAYTGISFQDTSTTNSKVILGRAWGETYGVTRGGTGDLFLGAANANASNGAYIILQRTVGGGHILIDGGNVGIGTTTPTGRLHSYIPNYAVTTHQYTGYFQNLATNTTTNGINKYGIYITSTGNFVGSTGTATNNYGLYVATPTGADNNYSAIFAGGNVGIGTATPIAQLDVSGTFATKMGATVSASTQIPVFVSDPSTNSQIMYTRTPAQLRSDIGAGAGTVEGTGIQDYVARWTNASTIGTGVLYDNGTNVGVGTTSPITKLHIAGDGGILAQGTYGTGWNGGSLGSGSRLMWIPSKAAFRAGYVGSTQWDTANIGNYSVAMGQSTTASGIVSTAMGFSTTASGYGSTAIGYGTTASNHYSTAMGINTTASGTYSTAMGGYTSASGTYSTAMGHGATASGDYSTAMGNSTTAQAYASTVLGRYNVISGTTDSWVATDPIFSIGIGSNTSNRANAMTVLKNGNVGIGTTSPSTLLQLGQVGTAGTLGIAGSTSGLVTLQTAAAAGTWTMTLPTSGGSNGQVLTTNGSGVTSWANVGTASNVALSGITAAISANSINSGDYAQVWNWQLTSANKVAFTFGENVASTATGSPAILSASTLASSTAMPLYIKNLGNANSFRVDDEVSDTTPFVIDASGNVGVGTASPNSLLRIHNGSSFQTPGTYLTDWGVSYTTSNGNLAFNNSAIRGGGYPALASIAGDGSTSSTISIPSSSMGFSSFGATNAVFATLSPGGSRSSHNIVGYQPMSSQDASNHSYNLYLYSDGGSANTDIGITPTHTNIFSNINKGSGTANYNVYSIRSVVNGNTSNNATGYGVYSSVSGFGTNYSIYSAAGTNYFAGNVGIGTATPIAQLDVSGTFATKMGATVSASTQIPVFVSDPSTNSQIMYTRTPAQLRSDIGAGTGTVEGTGIQDYVARWTNASTIGTGVLYDNGTNVGVGTTSPGAKLSVNTTSYPTMELKYNNSKVVDIYSNVSSNIFIGLGSGSNITSGTGNVGYGYQALYSNTTGGGNVASGVQALYSNTTGVQNIASGYQALYFNETGTGNVAIGSQALYSSTTTSGNVAIGNQALYLNTTGIQTVAIGTAALRDNTTGLRNVAIGNNALRYNTTGRYSVAIGNTALVSNTTGASNVGIGNEALGSNTTGNYNVASGFQALHSNVAKQGSTAIGHQAMRYADNIATGTTLTYNTALGYQALRGSTTAENNTGTYNTVLGANAGLGMTSGSNNTLVGYNAGNNLTTGSSNILIGSGVTASSATISNEINIGNVIYGRTDTVRVGIGVTSPIAQLDVAGTFATKMAPTVSSPTQIPVFVSDPSTNSQIMYTRTPAQLRSDIGAGTGTVEGTGIQDYVARWTNASTIGTGVLYDTGANVGIGTTTLGSRLVVKGSGNTSATSSLNIINSSDTSLLFVRNDGNVGIGTSTPGAMLEIAGGSSTISNSAGNITILPASGLLDIDGQVRIREGNPGLGKVLTSSADGTATWETPASVGAKWNTISSPDGNQSLSMGSYNTSWTWSTGLFNSNWTANAGTNNLFSLTTANGTTASTGALMYLGTGTSSTVNPLRIVAGGVEALFVSKPTLGDGKNSRVGLGTMSPDAMLDIRLHVDEVSTDFLSMWNGGTQFFRFEKEGTLLIGTDTSATGVVLTNKFYRKNSQLYWSGNTLWMDGGNSISSGSGVLGTTTNHSLQFKTNNLDRMIITNGGNVGIGTTTPATKLHLTGDGGILAEGTYGSGWDGGSLGAGTRLMWIPGKSAFRAGYVDSTQWNATNIGNHSVAIGYNAMASGNHSVAIGRYSAASGSYSTAMGLATASADFSTAMGSNTIANAWYSTAMGYLTTASGITSTAMGSTTIASGFTSTAMGSATIASGWNSTAMGLNTTAQAHTSTVIGRYNVVAGSINSWVDTDPIFAIGIGADASNRANAMTVLKNGNVGIGTSSPNHPLSIISAAYTNQLHIGQSIDSGGYLSSAFPHQFTLVGGARYSGTNWQARATSAGQMGAYEGALYFYTNSGLTVGSTFTPTERMRIRTDGRIQLATTNSLGYSFTQHVEGTTAQTYGISYMWFKPTAASSSWPSSRLVIDTGDDIQTQRSSGLSLGIGGTIRSQIAFNQGGKSLYLDTYMVGETSNNTQFVRMRFGSDFAERFRFRGDGTGYADVNWSTFSPYLSYNYIEKTKTKSDYPLGTVVSLSSNDRWTVTKSTESNRESVYGVIVLPEGFVSIPKELKNTVWGENKEIEELDNVISVAHLGEASTMVTTKGGNINYGDSVTTSSLSSFAQKTTEANRVLGTALESTSSWNAQTCPLVSSIASINWPADDGSNPSKPCFRLPDGTYVGKIMVFVNVSWHDPAPGELLARVEQLETQYSSINQGPNPLNSVLTVVGPSNTLTVDSHLVPNINNTYNIGSSTKRWKDIYTQGVISIGANGNSGGVKYDTETKELQFSNDGSNWLALGSTTNEVTLSAQYPGSITTSNQIETGVGDELSGFMHYYEFNNIEEESVSAEIRVRYTLPSNFASWTNDAIRLSYVTEGIDDDSSVDIEVFKQDTPNMKGHSLDNVSSVAEEWTSTLLSGSQLSDTCTEPGDVCIVVIKLHSKDDSYVRVGDIKFNYNRKL